MENVYFASASATSEVKFWSIAKDLAIETAIVAESSLFWLLLSLGSLQYNIHSLDVCSIDKSFPSKLIEKPKDVDAETMDEGKFGSVVGHKRQRSDETEDTADTFEELWSDDGEGDSDEDNDYDASDREGGDGNGEDDDEDDDDCEEDSSEEDEEEEEEESISADFDDASSSDEDMDDNPLLRHARKVYTYDNFCIFKHEYRISKVLSCDVIDERDGKSGLVFNFNVGKLRHCSMRYNVTAITSEGIVKCSCNYFSFVGILCSHALYVLQWLRIEVIPDHYLLKWMMRSSCSMQELSFLRGSRHQYSSDDCLRVSLGGTSRVDATVSKDGSSRDFDYIVPPLLRHAKSIYVKYIYNIFRQEYKSSEYLVTRFVKETADQRGIIVDCIVNKPGRIKKFKVHAEATDGTVSCSCGTFGVVGLLCSHSLAVLDCLCIVRIPPQCIRPKHLKGTNICGQEKIHGPRFAELEQFIRFRVFDSHLDTLHGMSLSCGQFNPLAGLEVKLNGDWLLELKGLSEDGKSEESASSTQEKVVKGSANFCDDQMIMSFTYKESETRRKLLIPYFRSST